MQQTLNEKGEWVEFDLQVWYRKCSERKLNFKGLLGVANNIDLKEKCLRCGGSKIKDLDWSTAPYDWQCTDCGTYQLTYLKLKGFRQYAFLLDGSWTSRNFYARSLKEAFKLACRAYGYGRNGVHKSYMVGGVDAFCLSEWRSF